MNISLSFFPLDRVDTDAVIVPVFEGDLPKLGGPALNQWMAELAKSEEFRGKALELAVLPMPADLKTRRLVLAGAGKREKWDANELRKLTGAAIRALKPKGVRSAAILLDVAEDAMVEAAVEGAILANWEPDRHKTGKKEAKSLEAFKVVVPGGATELNDALSRGEIIGEAQNLTRDLANEPGNLLPPRELAARAKKMAAGHALECEVLDEARMKDLGFGSLLGVSMGSAEPPVLIVLGYRPAKGNPGGAHLALVGKGVTFDTGGISIKPSEGMEKMKYDMAGGAAMIGAMQALAQLKPSIAVTAYIPAVENMPGSKAQRPGDIVKSLSGKTVEVLNTDAEGRLILIDAITYAKRHGATHMVDAATLTGAIGVALGSVQAGAFTNNDEMLARVMEAARSQGEKMWHMPLDEEYRESLKSACADMPNIGPRAGGAITAAMFLKEWAEDTPWVHLDIANVAWLDDGKPWLAKGPSGFGVRTFVQLAMGWKN